MSPHASTIRHGLNIFMKISKHMDIKSNTTSTHLGSIRLRIRCASVISTIGSEFHFLSFLKPSSRPLNLSDSVIISTGPFHKIYSKTNQMKLSFSLSPEHRSLILNKDSDDKNEASLSDLKIYASNRDPKSQPSLLSVLRKSKLTFPIVRRFFFFFFSNAQTHTYTHIDDHTC